MVDLNANYLSLDTLCIILTFKRTKNHGNDTDTLKLIDLDLLQIATASLRSRKTT